MLDRSKNRKSNRLYIIPPQNNADPLISKKVISYKPIRNSHSANGPWDKSPNFIFPTKHVIPESFKFSHWLSENLVLIGILYVFFPFRLTCTLFGFHYSCLLLSKLKLLKKSHSNSYSNSLRPSRNGLRGSSAWQKFGVQSHFSPNSTGDQNWQNSPFHLERINQPFSPRAKKKNMVYQYIRPIDWFSMQTSHKKGH